MKHYIKSFLNMSLVARIFIAMVSGLVFGIIFQDFIVKISFIGEIFLRLIQMSIVILVMGQVIEAVGKLEINKIGILGVKTVFIFGISSLLAASWGILFGVLTNPGKGIKVTELSNVNDVSQQSFQEILISFFPTNIIESMAQGMVVQVIIFSIFFGVALSIFIEQTNKASLINLLEDFNEVIMNMIKIIMKMAPAGVFVLTATALKDFGIDIILPLLKYLIIYSFATFSFLVLWFIVCSIVTGVNLKTLTKKMTNVSLLAVSTTSSAICLPVAIQDSENKLGINKKITQLVLPLGMPLNSNGAAMHMAITVITISQMYNVSYSLNELMYITVLATLSSLANAVVPGASLVSLAIIIPQVGLPTESIAMFAAVDYFVGMLRTILNVNSDIFSALMVAKNQDLLDYTILKDRKLS